MGDSSKSPSSVADATYEKLKEYEARRRSTYTTKFDAMSLHWKSYRDLLSASLSETSRAQRLILGTCRAHKLYSDALQAMYNDTYLDEKGNIATQEKQQRKLATTRKKEFRLKQKQIKVSSENGGGDDSKEDEGAVMQQTTQTPILKEIRDSQKEISHKIGENAINMDNEIAAEVGSLLVKLEQQFNQIEQLGSSVLSELEKTESEVVQSWGVYLRGQSSSPQQSSANNKSPQETAPGESLDPWLAEMQYRVAVAYQNSAWEKGNLELTSLFEKIKQEEMFRRTNLREYLVAFVQRQERMFVSLPGHTNLVLDELVGKEMSKEELELDIRSAIAAKVTEKFKKSASGKPKQQQHEELQLIGSPMSSDLLTLAKVLLRKGIGTVNGIERLSLGVITSDFYLHMFDLDQSKVKLGDEAETVFQKTMMPKVVRPSSKNFNSGISNFNKGWSDKLALSDSIILGNSTIQRKDDTSFELTEIVEKKGASKMFAKSAKKRVLLSTASKEECDEWISILTQ